MINDEGRLRWMCRRGMLELDVLFERFIDRGGYQQLSAADQELLEAMLQEPDPVLYSWLLGFEKADAKYVNLITLMTAEKVT